MTPRERFLAIARGELTNALYLPFNLNYAWFMQETVERWERQGLAPEADLAEFFGFDTVAFTGGAPYSLLPPFEVRTVHEDDRTLTVRDETGATKRVFRDHEGSTMPQWLDYPVKSRADFERLTTRLDPTSPERYPSDWEVFAANWLDRDVPLGLAPGSFFGHTLQRWVGTENLCVLFYDEPGFVHEMLEYLEWFFCETVKPFLARVQFDFASFGEDIAYKDRAFISPRMFGQFIQPRYTRICRMLRDKGIDIIFVDSDGNIDKLIPLWMQVGINAFSPLEVAAGMDALALKERYGRDIVLAGNIDKRALIRGKLAIDAEVERVRLVLGHGGYFPTVDHSVPPDVPFENFCYLIDRLKAL